MRTHCVCGLLLVAAVLGAQNPQSAKQPDLGLRLCWSSPPESALAHDPMVLAAVGRALALSGKVTSVGVLVEPCAKQMPDAACFGVPGGIMCQAAVIERQIRAAAWGVQKYRLAGTPAYERFRRANPEAVGYAFQYADGARPDGEADKFMASVRSGKADSDPLVGALVDYNLAALLGHELAHTNDNLPCAVAQKGTVEDSGLWSKIVRDELGGAIFGKHNAERLAYYEGMSQTEMAERLKQPLSTVKDVDPERAEDSARRAESGARGSARPLSPPVPT